MVFQSYALYPHMTVRRNIEFPLRSRKVPAAERDQLVRDAAESLVARRAARPQARAALGRPAPAGRAGAGDRAPPAGVPDGRAAVEPRRQAARADPRRAGGAAAAAVGHDHLRHPRPGRGDDDGTPHRGARRRCAPAGGRAPGRLRPAGEPVRGPLHRQPADEHGHRAGSTGSTRRMVAEIPGGRIPLEPALGQAVAAAGARRGRDRRAARRPPLQRRPTGFPRW